MIRFRYGPWDDRYRRWIGILVAKGLAETSLKGHTVLAYFVSAQRRTVSILMSISAVVAVARALASVTSALSKSRFRTWSSSVSEPKRELREGESDWLLSSRFPWFIDVTVFELVSRGSFLVVPMGLDAKGR